MWITSSLHYRRVTRIVVAAIGLTACDGGGTETKHPTSSNLIADREITQVLDDRPTDGADESLAALGSALVGAAAQGVLAPPPGSVDGFGRIVDVALDADGSLYVLDDAINRIFVYADDGSFRSAIPSPRRPRSASSPGKIDLDETGSVVIGERTKAAHHYQVDGAGLRHVNTIELVTVPESQCVIGRRLVVQGWSARGTTIHVYDIDGAPGPSFGREYSDPTLLVRQQLSDGLIACESRSSTIVAVNDILPYVIGYTVDGAIRWVIRLASFRPMYVTSGLDNGRPFVSRFQDRVYDSYAALVHVADDVVLVQTASNAPEDRVNSYLIDTINGRGAYLGTTVPLVTAATRTKLLSVRTTPEWQVQIFTWAGARRKEQADVR